MNVREASTASVDVVSTSTIQLMDLIPDSAHFEEMFYVPLKLRTKFGSAVVDSAVEVHQLDTSIDDSHYDDGVMNTPSISDYPLLSKNMIRSTRIAEVQQPMNSHEVQNEESESKLTKVRLALGRAAALANIKISKIVGAASPAERKERSAANKAKYAKVEGQRLGYRRSANWIGRNKTEIAGWAGVSLIGAIALERIGLNGYHLGAHFFENSAFADAMPAVNSLPEGPQTRTIDYMPLASRVDTIIVAGGATHGMDPGLDIADMQAKGIELGYGAQIKGVQYSGEIGPVVGTERMDESAAGGVQNMYDQIIGDVRAGKTVQLTGYSEGTLVAIDTYDRIVAENGGVAPANLLPPLLVATPYVQGGIMDNSFTGGLVGSVLDGMGIPTERKLPAGTIVKYYDSDIYANGGNMNPATLIKNALGLGMGNHDIPNEADLANTFTDSDGVIHMVYSRDDNFIKVLKGAGIDIKDTESANKMFAAFFPIGKDENGAFLKPDVRSGLSYLATTMDHQIDPSGNLHVVQDFMNSLPDEYKELGQRGMDGFNNIAEMAGKIQSGEVDPFTGFMSIMGSINSIMGGLQDVGNIQGQSAGNFQPLFNSWDSFVATASVSFQSDQNFAPQYASLAQDYFSQFKDIDTSSLVTTNAQYQLDYSYPQPSRQFEPYTSNPFSAQVAQSEPYLAPQSSPRTESVQLPTSAPVEVPVAQTPAPVSVSAPEIIAAPETIPESAAPTTPPAAYSAPVISQPVVESTPEAPAPSPAPAVEAPAPIVVDAPVAEVVPVAPVETYVAPPAPEPAPAVEAPAPIVDMPVFQAPAAPVFEAPSAPAATPSFSYGSSTSPSSYGSSSSSSSSSSSVISGTVSAD